MKMFKRYVVTTLETLCRFIDNVPWYYRGEGWSRCGQIGCVMGLARWSAELDERWGTGVWEPFKAQSTEAPRLRVADEEAD